MEVKQVITEVNNTNKQELTEEEKRKQKEQEIKEQNLKTREEAKKARRPTPARMAEEIRLMAKRAADPYAPTEAKYARALLGIFLKDLAAHKQGKHVEVANRILADMKEKRPHSNQARQRPGDRQRRYPLRHLLRSGGNALASRQHGPTAPTPATEFGALFVPI